VVNQDRAYLFQPSSANIVSFSLVQFSPHNLKIFATLQIALNDLLNPGSSALLFVRASVTDNAKSFPCMLASRTLAEIVFSAHVKSLRTRDAHSS